MKVKKQRCIGGHLQENVVVKICHNAITGISNRQFTCRKCVQKLIEVDNESLIGNPFGIVERGDSYRDKIILDSIMEEK